MDSIDISSLFTQRLHRNVGNYISVGSRRIHKKKKGQKEKHSENEKKKEKKRKKILSVKCIYTPERNNASKYWLQSRSLLWVQILPVSFTNLEDRSNCINFILHNVLVLRQS